MTKARACAVHVTHEAREKMGGIGTVLEGLITSAPYQKLFSRNILVGPLVGHIEEPPDDRLGHGGRVLYSSLDEIDTGSFHTVFDPIRKVYGVDIVYGTRILHNAGDSVEVEVESLLIDVFHAHRQRTDLFKARLHEVFGLQSDRFESDWGYEEWVRIAEPAFDAVVGLLGEPTIPHVMFGHEFMGIPALLKASMDASDRFRTVYYAHECPSARFVVESMPGHDVAFYNVLHHAELRGIDAETIFPALLGHMRHALVRRVPVCDGVIAVGDEVKRELRFLSSGFDLSRVRVIYNGIPAPIISRAQRSTAQKMLRQTAKTIVGFEPGVIMTHVARPVVSKAIWRDLAVCRELEPRFAARKIRGVLFLLTTADGVRRPSDVERMREAYEWPRHHRQGYPDLVGPEIELAHQVELFNQAHEQIQIVLVNQFGWSQERVGPAVPKDFDLNEFRAGTDLEFGLAAYEPFGISPLEPLSAGAICVISRVSGCSYFIDRLGAGDSRNIIIADLTALDRPRSIEELLAMTQEERDRIEAPIAAAVASTIMERLPRTTRDEAQLLESGSALARKMSWEQVAGDLVAPFLQEIWGRSVTPDWEAAIGPIAHGRSHPAAEAPAKSV